MLSLIIFFSVVLGATLIRGVFIYSGGATSLLRCERDGKRPDGKFSKPLEPVSILELPPQGFVKFIVKTHQLGQLVAVRDVKAPNGELPGRNMNDKRTGGRKRDVGWRQQEWKSLTVTKHCIVQRGEGRKASLSPYIITAESLLRIATTERLLRDEARRR
jgi:hypothetical protein